MTGQADAFEALVTLLGFLALLSIVYGVGAWWGDRKTERARHDLESYSTVFDRERIGR